MEFDELIKRQQAWIARGDEALERNGAPRITPELLAKQRREQANMMRESLDRLIRHRDETLQRLDALITEEREALKQLENEISGGDGFASPGEEPDRPLRPFSSKTSATSRARGKKKS